MLEYSEYPIAVVVFLLTFALGYVFIGKVSEGNRPVVRKVIIFFGIIDILIGVFVLENFIFVGGVAGIVLGISVASIRL